MVKIKIGSINCRGLASDKIKQQDTFLKCRQNYDITLLVDTHCKKELEVYWRSEWGYKARFFARMPRTVEELLFYLKILSSLIF
jgi:hypothetical protein